jgi:hypothetical protein
MSKNIVGPEGRLYAEKQPRPREIKFRQDNNSVAYYQSPYYRIHRNDVLPIPTPRHTRPIELASYLPSQILGAIKQAGKISFHAVGDTGAAKADRAITAKVAIGRQAAVADAMVADVKAGGPTGPAFFFHLGDIVYNFGEAQYYYDQFYEPYRAYDRPIFGVAGNHDGMVYGITAEHAANRSLEAYLRNFCAESPSLSLDAGGLARTTMTQPGVYFTLDAPFVSIIGLYSNVLDGPGVISSQKGRFPISDEQLDFLKSELSRLRPMRANRERAVVLAVHHPPLSADAKHGGSSGLQADLDECCEAAGLWPDLTLSGHAHLYQRFTRIAPDGRPRLYVVSGSGGYAITRPRASITRAPITIGDHTLDLLPIVEFGYLTVETDAKKLTVKFNTVMHEEVMVADEVTLTLHGESVSRGGGEPASRGPEESVSRGAEESAARKGRESASRRGKESAPRRGKESAPRAGKESAPRGSRGRRQTR